jgi:hypothetical protein
VSGTTILRALGQLTGRGSGRHLLDFDAQLNEHAASRLQTYAGIPGAASPARCPPYRRTWVGSCRRTLARLPAHSGDRDWIHRELFVAWNIIQGWTEFDPERMPVFTHGWRGRAIALGIKKTGRYPPRITTFPEGVTLSTIHREATGTRAGNRSPCRRPANAG